MNHNKINNTGETSGNSGNGYENLSEAVPFDPAAAEALKTEARKEMGERTDIETTRKMVPWGELVLPKTPAIDTWIAGHKTERPSSGDSERQKQKKAEAWRSRPVRLSEYDSKMSVENALYYDSEATRGMTAKEKVEHQAREMALFYLDLEMNGQTKDLEWAKNESVRLMGAVEHKYGESATQQMERELSRQVCDMKNGLGLQIMKTANPLQKRKMEKLGMRKEMQDLRDF